MSLPPLRLLLVEDNPGDALLFSEMLADTAGRVELAQVNRLAAARERLAAESFDLILLDLGLPDSSGIDTVRELQKAMPACAIIVLTGMADERIADEAIAAGAQDYLVKGRVASDVLARSIRYALERKRGENRLRRAKELSEALNRIDALIFSTTDIDTIARRVLAEASKAVGAELAIIFLPEGEQWRARYVHGAPELIGALFEAADIRHSITAVDEQRVVVKNDKGEHAALRRPWAQRHGLQAVVDSALNLREASGDLALYSSTPGRRFSEEEADFVGKAAAAVSLAMQNAALFAEARARETALRVSESNLRTVMDSVYDAIFVHDLDGRILDANRKTLEMYRVAADEVRRFTVRDDYSGPDNPTDRLPRIWRRVIEGEAQLFEWQARRPHDGSLFPVEVFLNRILLEGREVILASVRDITERKRMEEELRHVAEHDPLTGVPNRRLFMEILDVRMAEARRERGKLALLFIDLDRFKEVNDTLGHEAGDALLREVAVRLGRTVRQSDTVARFGGDEFCLLLASAADTAGVGGTAHKVIEALRQPFLLKGEEAYISASVGISLYPDDSEVGSDLLRYADVAMYRAKQAGKSTYRFFDPEDDHRALERERLKGRLRQALLQGELELHYQPLMELRSGKVLCGEALVRWRHPERGVLTPDQFIPLAEEIGCSAAIDEWVLHAAARQLRAWTDAGQPPTCLSINLSSASLRRSDLVEVVRGALDESGVPAARLGIEVSERAAIVDLEQTAKQLDGLAALGVALAIDDFGTGFASLSQITRLPVQTLKFERGFLRQATPGRDQQALLQAVTRMAHALHLRVLAEGVETEAQLDELRRSECDEAQGFLFNAPMEREAFERLLN